MKRFGIFASFCGGMAHLYCLAANEKEALEKFNRCFGSKVNEAWSIKIIDFEIQKYMLPFWEHAGHAFYAASSFDDGNSWEFKE